MGGHRRPKTEHPCRDCGTPFVGGPTARWGPCCRWKYKGRTAKKYVWTAERDDVLRRRYDSRVRNRAAEIAIALGCGWPAWVIKKRASALGLTQPSSKSRREWTPAELAFLEEHAGKRLTTWIARRLKRTHTSVVMKIKHLGMRAGFREGYTERSLAVCFGVDASTVKRWVQSGLLTGQRRGTRAAEERDPWLFYDRNVRRFIRTYPTAFRLDKVDQTWFMDLILGGGLLRTNTQAPPQRTGQASSHADQRMTA